MNRFLPGLANHLRLSGTPSTQFHNKLHIQHAKSPFNSRSISTRRFHSTRPQHQLPEPQQPPPNTQSTTRPETDPLSLNPIDQATLQKRYFLHPNLQRTELDNQPGLRHLPKTRRADLIGNLQAMTHHGPLTEAAAPANKFHPEFADPEMPTLTNNKFFRKIDPNTVSAAQKADDRAKMARKLTTLAIFIGALIATSSTYYESRGAFGDKKATDSDAPVAVDYTTRSISNQYHSVSPLAQEQLDSTMRQLQTPEQHEAFMQLMRASPPVFSSEAALKLPLFITHRPTEIQQQYSQIRHEIEMAEIYPDRPPLNNNTVDLYLDRVERMEREYRRAHDREAVKKAGKPTSIAELTNQIAFQMNIRK